MFLTQLWLLKGIYSLYGKHVHDVHQLVREKITVLKIHQKRLTYLLFFSRGYVNVYCQLRHKVTHTSRFLLEP